MKRAHFAKFALVLTLLFTNVKCHEAVAVLDVIELGTRLLKLVQEISEVSKSFNINVAGLTTETAQQINDQTPSTEIYKSYGGQWENIKNQYENLNYRLQIIHDTSAIYFDSLWANNHRIIKTRMRLQDSTKNAKFQAQWTAKYEETAAKVASAKKLIDDGNDLDYALKNAAGRADLAGYLGDLKGISADAESLAATINEFSAMATEILQREGNYTAKSEEASSSTTLGEETTVSTEPSSSSATERSGPVSCTISNLTEDESTNDQNQRGIRLTFSLNVINMSDVKGMCALYLYYANGTPVKGKLDGYSTSNGQASANVTFTPSSQNADFERISVFIPNEALDLAKGSFDLKATISIFSLADPSRPVDIQDSEPVSFSYNTYIN